ncbi:Sec63 [Ceratobasidium sp. 370]|nr:Sec63 [Ceratobasidium sp. 370]
MSNDFKSSGSQPHMEALNVMRHAPRMIAALVDIALVAKNGAVIVNGTSLMRSINAKAWEDRPVVLKQLEGIGEKSFKVLAEHGIATIKSLAADDPGRVEILLNRRPPFGSDLVSAARSLPRYSISIVETSTAINHAKSALDVTLSIAISAKLSQGKVNRFSKNFDTRSSSVLTVLSDNQYVDFRRISTKVLLESATFSVTVSLTKPSQTIVVIVAPVKFAGITERLDFKPSPPANAYPILNTRPLKESEYPTKSDTLDEDILDLTELDKEAKVMPTKPARIHRENLGLTKPRLPNGNYACREGLPKLPPSPKQSKARKPVEPLALSSPVRPPHTQRAKNVSEKQKSQLDNVHGKVNRDGTSSIKPGSLIRPKNPPPPLGSTSQYVEYLLNDPAGPMVSAEGGTEPSPSDSELPSPSAISFGKREASINSPDSYDDSEMDLWAANIPSEVLDVEEDGSIFFPVSERPRPAGQPPKPTTPLSRKGNKRSNDLVEKPEPSEHITKRPRPSLTNSEEVIDLATPTSTPKQDASEAPLSMLPRHEARKPLFRPSSSPPSPALATPVPTKQLEASPAAHGPFDAESVPGNHGDDIEKFLDDVFEGVKIIPEDKQSMVKRQDVLVAPRLNSIITKDTHAFSSGARPSPAKLQEQTYKPKETMQEQRNSDPMAELNAWLEENGL